MRRKVVTLLWILASLEITSPRSANRMIPDATLRLSSRKLLYTTQVLINPLNYVLKKGDIGYVICDDYEIVKEAIQITSQNSPLYQRY
jgi:hypothetical protein